MKKIGTAANAAIAATLYWNGDMPDGWSYLDSGCYRTVFRGPDGAVYKVQHDTDQGDDEPSENRLEAMNYGSKAQLIFSESSGTARLARCTYYPRHNVIAMEYIPTPARLGRAKHPAAERWFRKHNLFDVQYGRNCWEDANGILTMVDYVA